MAKGYIEQLRIEEQKAKRKGEEYYELRKYRHTYKLPKRSKNLLETSNIKYNG